MKKLSSRLLKSSPVLAIVLSLGLQAPLYSCVITVINDTNEKAIIVDHNDRKTLELQKGKSKTFGDAHVKAKFSIYSKQPRARSLDLAYEVQQIKCAGDNKPQLRLSDIQNHKPEVTELFSITEVQKDDMNKPTRATTKPERKLPRHLMMQESRTPLRTNHHEDMMMEGLAE